MRFSFVGIFHFISKLFLSLNIFFYVYFRNFIMPIPLKK